MRSMPFIIVPSRPTGTPVIRGRENAWRRPRRSLFELASNHDVAPFHTWDLSSSPTPPLPKRALQSRVKSAILKVQPAACCQYFAQDNGLTIAGVNDLSNTSCLTCHVLCDVP